MQSQIKLPCEQTSQITTKKCHNAITVTPCERAFTQCLKNSVRQLKLESHTIVVYF